jgi:hypothetical protein
LPGSDCCPALIHGEQLAGTKKGALDLGDHLKTGHTLSLQKRPTEDCPEQE